MWREAGFLRQLWLRFLRARPAFSKGNGLGGGGGRGGSKAHPCAVLPKRRIRAAFALGF